MPTLARGLLIVIEVANSLRQPNQHDHEVQRRNKLTRQLLIYCVDHPDGKDTLKGIRRWWFPAGQTAWSVDDIRMVLEELTARQWLISRTLRQAEEIYGVNKEKVSEIKKFLGQGPPLDDESNP